MTIQAPNEIADTLAEANPNVHVEALDATGQVIRVVTYINTRLNTR